jgi:hypothetical protein
MFFSNIMDVIKKSPKIAILFGLVAIFTSIILIIDVHPAFSYAFAAFWAVTGVLAFYSIKKR